MAQNILWRVATFLIYSNMVVIGVYLYQKEDYHKSKIDYK